MAIQIILDGPRNVVVKITNVDTGSDTLLSSTLAPASTLLNIDTIDCMIASTGSVNILWDADTDLLATQLFGFHSYDFTKFGGLTNNAGAGVTGGIVVTGIGTGTYTVILHCTKRGIIASE